MRRFVAMAIIVGSVAFGARPAGAAKPLPVYCQIFEHFLRADEAAFFATQSRYGSVSEVGDTLDERRYYKVRLNADGSRFSIVAVKGKDCSPAVDEPVGTLTFGTASIVLLVLAGGMAAAMVVLVLLQSRKRLPDADPPSSALRSESPAVVNLLVNGTRVTPAAVTATLFELAAQQVAEVFEASPDHYAIRLNGTDASSLSDCERAVANLLGESRSPAGELVHPTLGWKMAFRKAVMDEAVNDDLVTVRSLRDWSWPLLFAWAAGTVGLTLAGMNFLVAFLGLDIVILLVALPLGFLWAPRLGSFTQEGRAATAHWLGVREYLAEDKEFTRAPPTAVVVWGSYLAYAVALGTMSPNLLIAERLHPADTAANP